MITELIAGKVTVMTGYLVNVYVTGHKNVV